MRQLYILSLLCLGLGTSAMAQNYPSLEQFGKNRIQYRTFEWKTVRTSNFEIYFYEDGEQLANLAAQYAESDFDRITELLGYTPYNRIKIFLYNSPQELAQSNIGVTTLGELTRRELDLSKSRVELAFSGDQVSFRKELLRNVTMLFVYDMLYGGSLKDALQSSLLLTLPDWFMPGMAAYVAEGWSPELDDYMRDASINDPIRKPSTLSGIDAERVGQSIWNYIGQKYGRDNISNILNLTRIIRNEQNSIQSTLGISYNKFLRDWRDYYAGQAAPFASAFKNKTDDFRISLSSSKTPVQLNSLKLSPDKALLAYTTVRDGKYNVEVVNTATRKKYSLMSGGYRLDGLAYKPNMPLVTWQRDNRLVVLLEEKGRPFLYIYSDLEKRPKRVLRQAISGLAQVTSMDASADGGSLVLSAVRKGQNDLFLYSLNRNNYQQLTNDLYDDLQPRFVGRSGRQIVFSSNRLQDTLNVDKGSYKSVRDQFSIYTIEGSARVASVRRLTDSTYRALAPVSASDNVFYYVGEQTGIRNLYKRQIEEQTETAVTALPTGIMQYDYLPANGGFAYSSIQDGTLYIGFRSKLPESETPLPITQRAVSIGLRAAAKPAPKPTVTTDSALAGRDTTTKSAPASVTVAPPAPRMALLPGEVDTDQYEFDPDVLKAAEYRQRRAAATAAQATIPGLNTPLLRNRRRENVTVRGPFPYRGLFVMNDASSAWRIDPIRGFGYVQNIALNDLLENHIVKAGLFITTNLKNSDMWAEYQNLKYRVDYGVRVDRQTLFLDAGEFSQRFRFNKVALTASYPISVNTRFSVAPFYVLTRQIDLSFQGQGQPDAVSDYAGARAEVVFDNTKVNGMNMIEGTRLKVRYENYTGLRGVGESFNRLTADVRHYQHIHRDLVLALRLSYGQSGGAAAKQSAVGGMENWINNQKENAATNPLVINEIRNNIRDLFFLDFAAPLRGFRQGKLVGTSHLLFNAELRFPLIRYLYRGNITSNFLRNLQFVGFTDVGTAWNGTSGPFSRENSLNTERFGGAPTPFRVTLTNFKNPFLIGYGVGARTMLLGYYVKFDYAWGIENKLTNKPIAYVTLGYDF
ncbi:hypothetical protein [Fibrivirga algicola]|uniref:Translocation protein TolB n=1 Tax=Fibrivirga algicola TaxID=2950420 RepID=A0ABX0QQS5_9BACT|nr:hypothetical protein [Fibrivirga algicola]ARK11339.1 hypothetical protein A6C57_13995 [Fibrella sp. ES10-3-2-2]NID13217.1 hypothetical protein [Fibrivirga algicola]